MVQRIINLIGKAFGVEPVAYKHHQGSVPVVRTWGVGPTKERDLGMCRVTGILGLKKLEDIVMALVPGVKLGQALVPRDSTVDIEKAKSARIILKIEKKIDKDLLLVHPGTVSKMETAHGEHTKLLFYKGGFVALFKKITGVYPAPVTTNKEPQMLEYLKTPVFERSFAAPIVVLPTEAVKANWAMDGGAIHLSRKDTIFYHERMGRNIRWSEVIHFRAIPTVASEHITGNHTDTNVGYIGKGTSVPIEIEDISKWICPSWITYVTKRLEAGCIVCTDDVLKGAPSGIFTHFDVYWHNSSSFMSVFRKVKISFPQLLNRHRITGAGITMSLMDNAKKFVDGMRSVKDVAKLIIGSDVVKDENLSRDIMQTAAQIVAGRPYGISFGDRNTIMRPIGNIIKKIFEVEMGTSHLKDWNENDHLGIGMQWFPMGDSALGDYEVSYPKFVVSDWLKVMPKSILFEVTNGIAKVVKRFHWNHKVDSRFFIPVMTGNRGAVHMVRRDPQQITSLQPIDVIRIRDDFNPWLGIGKSLMGDLSADFDGDHIITTICARDFMSIERHNAHTLSHMPKWNGMKSFHDKYVRMRPARADNVPEHINSYYELATANAIGILSNAGDNILHSAFYLMKGKGWSDEDAWTWAARAVDIFEKEVVNKSIAGKKKSNANVVDTTAVSKACSGLIADGVGQKLINNKINFASHRNSKRELVKLKHVPAYISKFLQVHGWLSVSDLVSKVANYLIDNLHFKMDVPNIAGFTTPTAIWEVLLTEVENNPGLISRMNITASASWINIPILASFHKAKMEKLSELNGMSDSKKATGQIEFDRNLSRVRQEVWDNMMSRTESDNEKLALERILLCYAYIVRNKSLGHSLHGWLFSRISRKVFIEFHNETMNASVPQTWYNIEADVAPVEQSEIVSQNLSPELITELRRMEAAGC